MATKVRDAELTSVDFVKSGANPDADICLFKSREHEDDAENEGIMKGIWERFKAFMGGTVSEDEFQKSSIAKAKQQIKDENQLYTSVLKESMDSIILNDQLGPHEKYELMQKSMREFTSTMEDVIEDWHTMDVSINNITKSLYGDVVEEGEEKLRIDKSKLSEADRAQLETLLEKACAEEDMDKACGSKNMDKACGSKKMDKEFPPAKNPPADEPDDDEIEMEDDDLDKGCGSKVKKAMQEEIEAMKKNMAALQKSNEMDAMRTIAKKYTLLGKKEDELAQTLYDMKKSGEDTYNQYVSLLDQNLALVEKSGIFTEIGKSGNGGMYVGSDAESKIDAAAAELRKSNPDMNYYEAIEKAWEEHPELAAEYEKSYMERR